MANLQYKIHINAPRTKVWSIMLDDETYREWTATFMPGSYYEGDWSIGSKMRFLGPHPDSDKVSGMASIVKENRREEFISIEHYAEIHEGIEQVWTQTGFENYTCEEVDGGTDLTIDMQNVPDEYASMFDESWPKALEKLKALVESK